MEGSPSHLRVVLGGALLIAAAMGIGRFAYTPLLPPMVEGFDWTVAQAGDVASANYLGYLLGALLASWLPARGGVWPWLLAGAAATVATTGAGMWVEAYWPWLVLRFASGVASALCMVFGAGVIMAWFAGRGRYDLGTAHLSGVGAGIVLSVLVIAALRGAGAGVAALWGALGAFSLLLAGLGLLLLRPLAGRPARVAAAAGPAVPVAGDPAVLRRHIAAYGLFGFGYVVTATFIVAMARTVEAAAWLEPASWLAVGVLAVPSVWFWQRMALRFDIARALRIAYLLEAAGVLLAGFAAGPVAVLVGGALLGGTFAGITAVGLSAARAAAGRDVERALALMTASFGLGQLLGPLVAGRLAEISGGFGLPSLLAAGLLALGAGLLR